MRRSSIKRSTPKRQISPLKMAELREEIAKRDGGDCIGQRAGIIHDCNIHLTADVEHLIEQREIRKICGDDSPALTDTRLLTLCCRNLNGALFARQPLQLADYEPGWRTREEEDARARRRIRDLAPDGFAAAIREYGLESAADRKLGPKHFLNDRSAIICHNCADFIQSHHRHDFRSCKCGDVSIDGGGDYLRCAFTDPDSFTVIKPEEIGSKWMHDQIVHWETAANLKNEEG